MLPRQIINHPFFHAHLDELSAREFLKKTTEANFLFCNSKSNKKFNPCFLLLYKASFRGQEEIRALTLNYNESLKTIEHASLGASSTLSSVVDKLPKFLNGFSDDIFNPSPCYNQVTRNNINKEIVQQAIPGLPNDVAKEIFSNLDLHSLYNSMQVSKSWAASINKNLFTIFKANDQVELTNKAGQKQKIQNVFEKIKSDLLLGNEGTCLMYQDFILSEPQWYSSVEILCRIQSKEENGYLFIGNGSLRWAEAKVVEDKFVQRLEEACRLGKNSSNLFCDERTQQLMI